MGFPESNLADEAAILARIHSDPQAFGDLYDAFFPRVYNYFRYRAGERKLADDLTAMTFEQAWLGLGKFRPERGAFAGWLFTIARNLMNDQLRFEKRHPQTSLEVLPNQPGKGPSPEQVVIHNETQAELLAAVASLDERQRDLIALKFAARLTNRQIAAMSGLSESNVGVILYRTLQRLRRELGNEEPSDE